MCSLCGYLLVRKNEWFKFVTEVLTRESKKKWKRKIIKMKLENPNVMKINDLLLR